MAGGLGNLYLKFGSFVARKVVDAVSPDGFGGQDENKEDVAVSDLGTNDTPCIEFKDESILKYIDEMGCTPKERRTSALSYQSRYYKGNEVYTHRNDFNKNNLRIGDSCFYVPPSYISVSEISNTVREPGIRMSTSVKLKHAYSSVDINIEMYFNGDEQINGFKVESPFSGVNYYVDGLRPFIAQCKLSPIMPVENEFLNFKNGIYAIAIQSVNISTVPGFPKLLKVNVNAVECNHSIYTMTPDYMFSDLIDWDLYKYNYQRLLTNMSDKSINPNFKLNPVENFSLEHKMKFSIISNLSKINDDNIDEMFDLTKADYETVLDTTTNEFTVQQINFGLSNIVINTQLSNHTKPAIQYLGGNDSVFTIQVTTSNAETVSLFKNLTSKVKYLSQQLRESTGTGFLKIDNNLINLLGVKFFLLESINIETVPNFPNLNVISIDCVSYDNVTAMAEELDGFNPFENDRAGTDKDTIKQNVNGLYNKITQDVLSEIKMCDSLNLYPDLMLPTFSELDAALPKINAYREKKGVKKLPFETYPRIAIKDYKCGKPYVYDYYVDPDYYFLYSYNTLSDTMPNIDDILVDKGTNQELKTLLKQTSKYENSLIDNVFEKINTTIINKEVTNKIIEHTYFYTLEEVTDNLKINFSSFFNGSSSNNSGSSNETNNSIIDGTNIIAKSATEAFLKCLWSKVDNCGYLYGAYGQIMTMEFAQQMRNQHGSICRINEKWLGKQVFDCSGYVAWGMREVGYTDTPARTSNMGLLQYCTKIPKSDLQPGDLLVSSGHIAVYVGNNETIEAMGADYGVCKGTVKSKYSIFARINWPQDVIDKWKKSAADVSASKGFSTGKKDEAVAFSIENSVSTNSSSESTIPNLYTSNYASRTNSKTNVTIEKMLIKYNFSARNGSIKYIVIHDTANTGAGADVKGHFNYFNSANRKASADYFVDDKRFGQFIEDSNRAFHCGDGNGKYGITNDNSVGIEICINSDGNYNKAVNNTIELTKYLMNKYSIPVDRVVRHYDASRKTCPGTMMANDWKAWKEFKKALSSSSTYVFSTSGSSSQSSSNNTTTQKTITLGKYNDDRDRHDDVITQASKKHGMSPNWFKALITQESSMNEKAGPNSCGAVGLMQITRDPCSELGVPYDTAKLKDPAYNVDIGMRYLKTYKKQVKGNYLDLACLHNCGPGRFADYQKGAKDLPSETKTHRKLVQKYYDQLISSGGQEGEYTEDGNVVITGGGSSGDNGGTGSNETVNEYYTTKIVHRVIKDHGKKLYSNLPSRSGSGAPSYQMPYSLRDVSTYAPNTGNKETEPVDDGAKMITINKHTMPIGVPLTDYSPVNSVLKEFNGKTNNTNDQIINAGATGTSITSIITSKSISIPLANLIYQKIKTEFDNVDETTNSSSEFLSEKATSKNYNEALNKFKDKDNKSYLSTMTVDDSMYNARCSMLRAFPTYCVLINDDNNNWYDGQKLWNNYYPYKSVVSISTFHEREQPVGTMKLSVTNLTNHLNKIPSREGLKSTLLKDLKNNTNPILEGTAFAGLSKINYFLYKYYGFILGSPKITTGMIEAKNKLVKNMKLLPGARVHVRFGYGSNPLSLNVMFNGTIAEVSTGEILEMVAQSDGAELINNVVSLKENTKNHTYNDMGLEASSIISSMLTDRVSWTNIVSPKWGEASKYNIEHFGLFTGSEMRQFRTAEYDMCKNIYFGNYYKNFYCGGRTDITESDLDDDEKVKEYGGIGLFNKKNQTKQASPNDWKSKIINAAGTVANVAGNVSNVVGNIMAGGAGTAIDEVANIVSGVGSIVDGAGSGEDTIKMYVYNKTPWDVMQTATSTLPEFICQPMYHQFDSRIYFGLPTWLCKYRYDMLENGNVVEQAKSFQQVHLVNCDDILDNRMRCSNKFFYTNVVSMYNQGGELKACPTMYSDRTIDWSKQKTKVVNTDIVQDYFGPDALYSTIGYEHGKVAAIGNAITNLIDSYDKQYFDEVITLGKPGIKPCDMIFINDNFAEIYGLANVRSVTHTFSPQTGFITNITPGLVSYSKIEDTGCSNSHNSIANFYDLLSNILEAKKTSIDKLNLLSPYLYQAKINNEEAILQHCSKILENPAYDIEKWIEELEKATSSSSTKKFALSKEIRNNHLKELIRINNNNNAIRYFRSFVFRLPIVTKITDYIRYGNCIIARPLLYKGSPFIAGIKGSENLIPGYSYNPYKPEKGDVEDETKIEEFDEN